MKDTKFCKTTACCWAYRHELLGLILLVIATFLTIVTANSFGIAAMFLVALVLCCYRHLSCHAAHGNTHCHVIEDDIAAMTALEKEHKAVRKVTARKK
jgi:hypothetical protein